MKKYPQLDEEFVWLTQAIWSGPELVKMVFVGCGQSVSAAVAQFHTGKSLHFNNFEENFYVHFEKVQGLTYRSTRLPFRGTAYFASVLTCVELASRMVSASQVEQVLLHEIKNKGLPCLPEWCAYLRDHLGEYLKPLQTCNAGEDMYLLDLPGTDDLLDKFLVLHQDKLKEIAEGVMET
jgi:hypothetical protein